MPGRVAKIAGVVAVAMSLIAVIPAYAAFTPAVLLALLALLIAAGAAYFDERRLSLITLVVVSIAVIISPIFTSAALSRSALLMAIVGVPYVLFIVGYCRATLKGRVKRAPH